MPERFSSTPIDRTQVATMNAAVRVVEDIYDCALIGFIGLDPDGRVFFTPRESYAKEVVDVLARADWGSIMRLVEEMIV